MGTTGGARNVARAHPPLAVAIPSEQGVLPINHDSSASLRFILPLCPAYDFCKESKRPCSSPVLDRDPQITTLQNLLQAMKEAALKLIQLITIDIEERRKRDANPWTHNPGLRGDERREQLFSSESELILGMSSSVCALCGVALHLKASSEKPKQFVVDRERNGDYISSGQLDDIFLKIVGNSSGFSFAGSVLNYVLPEKNNSTDKCMKREDRISSKTQSTESSKLKSKLLFIQQISSDRSSPTPKYLIMKREYMTSSHQCVVDMSSTVSSMQDDASTLTQDVFCPCACGLFVKDGTETQVSINSVYIPKDKLIKTKLEKLDLNLETTEIVQKKVCDNTAKIGNIKTQNLEKDTTVKHWIQEVVQLRLQIQIEKLHKSIEFFKRENEYIRCLVEKCRSLSEDITDLHQLLPNRDGYFDNYSGFRTMIRYLLTKYHDENGIMTTLIRIFQGLSIQQMASRLLAPFLGQSTSRNN